MWGQGPRGRVTLRSHQKLPVPTKCRLSPLPCFFFFFLRSPSGLAKPPGAHSCCSCGACSRAAGAVPGHRAPTAMLHGSAMHPGHSRTWSIPRQCCPYRAPPEDSWSPPGMVGENGGLPWRPGLCQLLWGFPFYFHSFCMFHIFRAKRIQGEQEAAFK